MTSCKKFGSLQMGGKSLNSLNSSESTKLAKAEIKIVRSILTFQLYPDQGILPFVIQLHLKNSMKLRRENPIHIFVKFEFKFERVYSSTKPSPSCQDLKHLTCLCADLEEHSL